MTVVATAGCLLATCRVPTKQLLQQSRSVGGARGSRFLDPTCSVLWRRNRCFFRCLSVVLVLSTPKRSLCWTQRAGHNNSLQKKGDDDDRPPCTGQPGEHQFKPHRVLFFVLILLTGDDHCRRESGVRHGGPGAPRPRGQGPAGKSSPALVEV